MSELLGLPLPNSLAAVQVTIPSGASISEMIFTNGKGLIGLFTPTNGWTDAAIGFKVGYQANALYLVNAYNNGATLEQCLVSTDAAAASIWIPFPQPDVLLAPYVALTSVVAGATTTVNQAAARVITLLYRNYLD